MLQVRVKKTVLWNQTRFLFFIMDLAIQWFTPCSVPSLAKYMMPQISFDFSYWWKIRPKKRKNHRLRRRIWISYSGLRQCTCILGYVRARRTALLKFGLYLLWQIIPICVRTWSMNLGFHKSARSVAQRNMNWPSTAGVAFYKSWRAAQPSCV